MSDPALEQMLEAEFADGVVVIGEVFIRKLGNDTFELAHRSTGLRPVRPAGVSPAGMLTTNSALEITKFDDAGKYRPLKTAPSLRHGWKIIARNLSATIEVIEAIYPGRLAVWRAWKTGRLKTTSLRQTLNRQSGMYRVAAKISDDQINEVVGNFCRSDGGCLRTILWRRDESGASPSNKLSPQKFDPAVDQFVPDGKPRPSAATGCTPLLCQEACNLLVAACRDAVKSTAPTEKTIQDSEAMRPA